jgi:hypothetical protein
VRKRFATDEIYSQPHYLTLVLKNMGSIASVFRLNGSETVGRLLFDHQAVQGSLPKQPADPPYVHNMSEHAAVGDGLRHRGRIGSAAGNTHISSGAGNIGLTEIGECPELGSIAARFGIEEA